MALQVITVGRPRFVGKGASHGNRMAPIHFSLPYRRASRRFLFFFTDDYFHDGGCDEVDGYGDEESPPGLYGPGGHFSCAARKMLAAMETLGLQIDQRSFLRQSLDIELRRSSPGAP